MKRFFLGALVAVLFSIANIGLVHAGINDFAIRDFQADYYLDKDSDGRSTLKTIELITAEFPSYDQNHGIERAIPMSYDGHSTNLDVQSVTNENDASLSYSTYESNGNSVLRIGGADTYVHGINIYKITYTQRDVTRFFADTNSDEFYWDTNGTNWSQDFDNVTARLHIASNITDSLTGDKSCYYGVAGSTDLCEIIKSDDGTITANVSNLSLNQNMTIAVGFKPQTFNGYKQSPTEILLALLAILYVIFCIFATITIVILLIVIVRLKIKKGKGAPGRGTIIAEYLPPKNVDVALSAVITSNESTWTAATYVDLAVRHNIKIIERKEGIFKKSVYSLQYVSGEGLTTTEMAIIDALFDKVSVAGTERTLSPNNPDYKLSSALMKIFEVTKTSAKSDGYYEDDKNLKSMMKKIIAAIAILGFLSFFSVFGFIVGIIGIIISSAIMASTNPLSVKGRELLDYLEGLKLYIKVAEEDRIKVLQSPQGAEKTPIDTNDSAMMVKLYEKVLPYAILFGNEKEWANVLGKFYEQQGMQPSWYSGSDIFNAILFSSAVSSFSSSAITNTYSSPSSSSSGGSSGGGSSGGGGGGGGGGGW